MQEQDQPPEIPAGLSAPVETLLGVGPSLAGRLDKLGVVTVEDLLRYYPRRYVDYSATKPINQLQYGEEVTILGRVWETSLSQTRSKRPVVRAVIGDGTGKIQCIWFNQPYLIKQLTLGSNVSISGQVGSHLGRARAHQPGLGTGRHRKHPHKPHRAHLSPDRTPQHQAVAQDRQRSGQAMVQSCARPSTQRDTQPPGFDETGRRHRGNPLPQNHVKPGRCAPPPGL